MKKDIEWLKEEITEVLLASKKDGTNYFYYKDLKEKIYNAVDQLDELEVLSQEENINIVLDDLKEHIKEQQSLSQNVGLAHTSAMNDTHYRQYDYVLECINEYEPSEDLKDLLVPKQEKVKIPYFIEKHIQASLTYSEESTVVGKIENYMLPRIHETETDPRVLKFFSTTENIDLVALAMITENYEVETEQRYYVMNNDNRMMLVRMMDGKTITEADPFRLEDMYEAEKKSHRLTEQEIKGYDERYWAFRKPVEELE